MNPALTTKAEKTFFVVTLMLRVVLWFWCFASIEIDWARASSFMRSAHSAVQEQAAMLYAIAGMLKAFLIASILDMPLRSPWRIFLARGARPSSP